jgi:hypothetical protein
LLNEVEGLELVSVEDDVLTLAVPEATRKLSRIFKILGQAGAEVRETTLNQPNLETLFIKLTGRELRE